MKNMLLMFALCFLSAAAVSAQTTPTPTPTPDPAASPAASPAATPSVASTESSTTNEATIANTSGSAIQPGTEKTKPVRIPRFEKPPVIDGRLDDAMWTQAAVLKDFLQVNPGDNIAPSKPTEVLIGYDSKFLYIAFRAFDEPDKVRSTVAKRDNIFNDDYVGFFLDTFNDKRKSYAIFFNPLGVQADGVMTEGRGEDYSVDLLMDSKGIINETGFTVEIAIPFKSLRYEAGKDKLWNAHFFRRIKRFNNELDSWMPLARNNSSTLAQAGHLTGLEGISTERTIELIPSLTISETGRRVRSFPPGTNTGIIDQGRFVNEAIDIDPGLTAKFGISPTMTLDLALNPDFAQVEADQLVVTANQRFPIFFAEKRPFFLEGIDIFSTPITAVHTRAIVDPDVAVKLTGRSGRNTYGIMLASDNGPGNITPDERTVLAQCLERRTLPGAVLSPCANERLIDANAQIGVLRLKRDIGKSESTIGMIATSYNLIDKHNQLGGFDGRFRLNKQTVFNFQVLGTTSRNFFFDPNLGQRNYRTGNGFGYSTTYDVSGRNWGWQLYGEGFTRDYRADMGFFTRTNSNFNSFYLRYNSDRKTKGKVLSYHLHNFTHIDYNWQAQMYIWESENLVEWGLTRNGYFGLAYEYAYERLFEHEFGAKRTATRPGAFFGESNERSSSKNHYFIYGGMTPNKTYQFSFRAVYRDGNFDLDFGNGQRYPRVSPAAIAQREAQAAGLCVGTNQPATCRTPALDPGPGGLFELSGGIAYQPTNELRMSLNLVKNRLKRYDTDRVAFDINIFTYRATYQFTKATFARAIIDYNTLNRRVRSQLLLGWTPSPGTSFYAGYNDDSNFGGFSPINGLLEPGFRRNGRTAFIKMSYLFRRSIG